MADPKGRGRPLGVTDMTTDSEPKWLAGPLVGAGIVLRLVQDLAASSIPFILEAADSGGVWRFGAGGLRIP